MKTFFVEANFRSSFHNADLWKFSNNAQGFYSEFAAKAKSKYNESLTGIPYRVRSAEKILQNAANYLGNQCMNDSGLGQTYAQWWDNLDEAQKILTRAAKDVNTQQGYVLEVYKTRGIRKGTWQKSVNVSQTFSELGEAYEAARDAQAKYRHQYRVVPVGKVYAPPVTLYKIACQNQFDLLHVFRSTQHSGQYTENEAKDIVRTSSDRPHKCVNYRYIKADADIKSAFPEAFEPKKMTPTEAIVAKATVEIGMTPGGVTYQIIDLAKAEREILKGAIADSSVRALLPFNTSVGDGSTHIHIVNASAYDVTTNSHTITRGETLCARSGGARAAMYYNADEITPTCPGCLVKAKNIIVTHLLK